MAEPEQVRLMMEILDWIKENEPNHFYELWHFALENREDWAAVLRKKSPNYTAKEYIRSSNRTKRKAQREQKKRTHGE